jgi:hypothetical protein
MARRILMAFATLLLAVTWAYAQAPVASPPPLAAPAPPANPQDVKQVNVSVKIVEFQTSKDSETGLSAYFKQRQKTSALGQVLTNLGYVKSADVTSKLFSTLAERYRERPGGYTRVLKLRTRVGDAAPISIIELVDREMAAKVATGSEKPAKAAKAA